MIASRKPIFEPIDRFDASPAQHGESTFQFLNRVAGDYWTHPRRLTQHWADRIVDLREYHDLRQRLRSRDDEQFRSAFLELYLHECLVRAGYVVTIHPVLPATSRRPDFLAERVGERMYVEAIAPGSTPEAKAVANRRAVLFDAVNRLDNPNFLLWLERLEEGSSPPASARLRAALRQWLDGLDPDGFPDLRRAPTWRWQQDGWAVSFKAVPRRPGARGVGASHRAIGVYGHTEAAFVDDAPTIRTALEAKDHAYGDLAAPFVVALGTYIFDTDRWHSMNALYGMSAVQIGETSSGNSVTWEVRQPDGYFGVPPGWANRNVSGVLLVNQLMPYNVNHAETTLWRHPAASRPLPSDVGFPGHELELRDGALTEARGNVSPQQFFDLPEPWPPGDPWADG